MSTQKFYFLAIPVTTCSVEGGKIQCNFALIQKHTFVFSQKARQVTAVLLNGFLYMCQNQPTIGFLALVADS